MSNDRIIFLNKEVIDLEYAGNIAFKLFELEQESMEPIVILINSKGGEFSKNIINAMNASSLDIYTCAMGTCLNEAILILLSGHEVSMFKNSEFTLSKANSHSELNERGYYLKKEGNRILNFTKITEKNGEEIEQELISKKFDTFNQFLTYVKIKNDMYRRSITEDIPEDIY